MDSTTLIGIAAGTCTGISLLPQLIKIIKEKNVGNLSMFYLLILLSGLILWIWYGIRKEDIPVLATNIVSLILNIIIIIMTKFYERRNN